jgi:hypothetical protein
MISRPSEFLLSSGFNVSVVPRANTSDRAIVVAGSERVAPAVPAESASSLMALECDFESSLRT